MAMSVNSYAGVDASGMSLSSDVEFIIDDFPSDKLTASTNSKVKCYAYHNIALDTADATGANFVQSDSRGTISIGTFVFFGA